MQKVLMKTKKIMNVILSFMAAFLLITMTFLVIWQVFTRYVLNNPAAFTEELVRYLLIWTGFIGAAYAFNTRQHMALLFVRDKFHKPARKALIVGVDVLIIVFALLVMVIGGYSLAYSARMEFSALLGIPRSLVYSMAPISGIFIIIGQVINIWEDVTGIGLEENEK